MRIRGYFGRFGAPTVDAKLARADNGEPIDVNFLIDTGALHSLIGLREIHRLKVSVHELRRSVGTFVVMGGRAQFYFLQNVSITFQTDCGPHTEHLSQILTAVGPATSEHRKRPPVQNLLGRDILDRFALCIDKRTGLVLLTDEPILPEEVPHEPLATGGALDRRSTAVLPVAIAVAPEGEGLPLPQYATDGSVGLDLLAAIPEPVTLAPGERRAISTGIRIALPPGYEAQVRPRSGLARDHGLGMVNAPGTIDPDFRGTIQVLLINLGHELLTIRRGERIAQMVIAPVARVVWQPVDELPETARGDGGFGHTGRD